MGIDLIGPLPFTESRKKYIITLVDYFSKWPEAEAVADKQAITIATFLFKTICRLGKILLADYYG